MNSSRPGGLHRRRCHRECSSGYLAVARCTSFAYGHSSRQSMFCSTPSNTQCASFADTHHLVDTCACTCGDKGGLLQLSSLGFSRQLLQRLQSVFNAAARLVFSARKSEHITPLLCELHWLKVPERIQFRLCVLAYLCLIGTAPSYLAFLRPSTQLPT